MQPTSPPCQHEVRTIIQAADLAEPICPRHHTCWSQRRQSRSGAKPRGNLPDGVVVLFIIKVCVRSLEILEVTMFRACLPSTTYAQIICQLLCSLQASCSPALFTNQSVSYWQRATMHRAHRSRRRLARVSHLQLPRTSRFFYRNKTAIYLKLGKLRGRHRRCIGPRETGDHHCAAALLAQHTPGVLQNHPQPRHALGTCLFVPACPVSHPLQRLSAHHTEVITHGPSANEPEPLRTVLTQGLTVGRNMT